MSREIRKVPANWKHPKNTKGYIPLRKSFPYNDEEIQEGLRDGWLEDKPPHYGVDVMPQWSDAERTHWQMYESTSEGTPISPVMESPEALASWLADSKATAFADMTATYDQWLTMIHKGYSCGSFVINLTTYKVLSGVEQISRSKK